ncbi:MAG TPA: secretin N-terminal domain-containing protein [Candidatus Acidoferrum sp.]|nr:secretin N-terminal domain-containing protein [Candidatus Acidoferrum sp.]
MKLNLRLLTLVGVSACALGALSQTNVASGDAAAPAVSAEVAAPAASKPSPAPAPGAVIPLIVMDDVPLTDAIRNLARQANLNYLLDPKIGFGQLGPDGKPVAQPSVSIRWENITAEQALNALLNNYSLQMVEDARSRIARVTIKDPAAPDPLVTRIIQLKYASPSNIVVSVQAAFTDKRSKVLPDYRTSQLVVVATERELSEVTEMIDRLDSRTRQVLIEARLLETSMNPTTSKGIDWSGTLAAQHVSYGNGILSGNINQNYSQNANQSVNNNRSQNSSQNNNQNSTTTSPGAPVTTTQTLPGGQTVTTTVTPTSDTTSTSTSGGASGLSSLLSGASGGAASSGISSLLNSIVGNGVGGLSLDTAKGLNPATFFLNADGVKATLSFLNTYAETKIISAPRTVTLDNEQAVIEVGTQFPIVNTTAGTANTTGGSQITYSNLTVKLQVTPRISANDYVKLQVMPSVVRLGDLVTSVVGGVANSVYEFNTRQIVTSVLIPSGNTLVMGGLISDEIQNGNAKVPLLGDLPVLGLLFRSDTKSRTKSNLIVFLTPTIVEEEDYQPTKSTFLKNKVPAKDELEKDWSAWDSGKPMNWTKKMVAPQNLGTDDSASAK